MRISTLMVLNAQLEGIDRSMENIHVGSALIIIIIIIIISMYVILFRNYKILKIKTDEIDNFNELRKGFIDADDRLIYLKDENLKYIFINKALEKFYNKDTSEVIGRDDFDLSDKDFAEIRKKTDLEVLHKLTEIETLVNWNNRIYKTNKFPIKLLNGSYGVGAYIEDLTEEYNIKLEKEKANIELMENKDKLQLILNSTAEAIYGMDIEGNCTFCNTSFLKILGYQHPEELIGKNVHYQIHHSYEDGTTMQQDDCKIIQALKVGKGTHVNDEVFWRSDGTSFDVEYNSYPQFKDSVLIGAVVTFMDITERKKSDEEIKYLSYHDSLTGFYNRMFFEEELRRLDTQRNLPISIIVGDVNGLKLTNDIFGHAAGDNLLKKVAEIYKNVFRADDIIARVGGDEFIVLLPKTNTEEAEKIIRRIKDELSKEQIIAIRGSISMGNHTKENVDQDIFSIMEDAETKMYQEKTLNRKNISSNQIKTIIETLHGNSPKEEKHSKNVSELCEEIGRAMKLTNEEIKRLKDAGYLHDIGKIVLSKDTINNIDDISEQEMKKLKQHSVVGYRILNSFDDTLDLAESVLSHHEYWDGSGYPKGLKGEEIPKLARIISVAESYDSLTNDMNKKVISKEEALKLINKQSGVKYDPEIVDIFNNVMLNKI